MLLAGWECCHYKYHFGTEEEKARIYTTIIRIRGVEYEDELRKLEVVAPLIKTFYLKMYLEALRREAKK
ncbi:unnamed protein product [marine sediment metagenome]|uniref:Uncharacterized protein n=1 Tax=marine sediment metagenome TaxID=412755 RepID=X1DTQ4_9ZZZZ